MKEEKVYAMQKRLKIERQYMHDTFLFYASPVIAHWTHFDLEELVAAEIRALRREGNQSKR